MIRYLGSFILGGIVTLLLAYFMQMLIFPGELPEVDDTPTPMIVITMPPEPPIDELIGPIRADPEPTPPPPSIPAPEGPSESPPINMPDPTPITVDPGETPLARILTPMVRIPPEYPPRALERGIEGYVVLRFEVNAEGRTQNIRVYESEPGTTFDNAAIRAVADWRYQAQTDSEGNPVTVGGQQTRLEFFINPPGAE